MRQLGRLSLVAMAMLAACSGGDKIVAASGGNTGPIALTADDSTFFAGLMLNQVTSGFKNLRVMQATDPAALAGANRTASCNPTLGGTADQNGNGIPEDQSLTFTAQNCTGVSNGATSRIVGSIRVQDLGALRGYRVIFGNLTQTTTLADTTLSIVADGQMEFQWQSVTAARFLSVASLRLTRQEPTGGVAITLAPNLAGQFQPNSGKQIQVNTGLPAGQLTASGTLGVTLVTTGAFRPQGAPSTIAVSLSINTSAPMTFNGICQADRAFDAGGLTGSLSGGVSGVVTSGFTGCGSGVVPPVGPPKK